MMTKRNRSQTMEKFKVRRRKLRDNEEQAGRELPASEERSAEDDVSHAPRKVVWAGGCDEVVGGGGGQCGPEAACQPLNATHYSCLCISDAKPATADLRCPRSTVPLNPKPIPNVIPPASRAAAPLLPDLNTAPVLTHSTPQPTSYVGLGAGGGSGTRATLVVGAGAGAGLLVLMLLVGVYLLRRTMCRAPGKLHKRVRPGEPLLAQRYITNPQYGVYRASPGAPQGAAQGAAQGVAHGEPGGELPVTLLDRAALTFLEEVGEGCFGKVFKGLLQSEGAEREVAIKVLKVGAGRGAEEDFTREVSIMSAFSHPNILSLVGVVYREEINQSPWMVFEYMEWGDLAGVLRGAGRSGGGGGGALPTLDAGALLDVALQVARGMSYLAARRFVHRDLAARNCLVGGGLAVKIADFGMSRDVYTCDYYRMGGERPMPVRWMSPESILYARFTHQSDVWAYGVLLWEVFSRGRQPYYGRNNDAATRLVLQGVRLVPPPATPPAAKDLMLQCWRTEPAERPAFPDILRKLELGASPTRLPRPPSPVRDAQGYLFPRQGRAEYFQPQPDPPTDSSEEEDDYQSA